MLHLFNPKQYNEQVQRKLGSKTKPEPWMHIAVFGEGNSVTYERTKDKADAEQLHYAIYVWDTRKVIESGTLDYANNEHDFADILFYFSKPYARKYKFIHAKDAKDNHKPLQGTGTAVSKINRAIFIK